MISNREVIKGIKILCYLGFSFIVVAALLLLTFFLGYSNVFSGEAKSSPFECGFLPLGSFNSPFSISFFIISLMFLLFDVEILLVCLLPLVSFYSFYVKGVMWVVLFIILFSTLYE